MTGETIYRRNGLPAERFTGGIRTVRIGAEKGRQGSALGDTGSGSAYKEFIYILNIYILRNTAYYDLLYTFDC